MLYKKVNNQIQENYLKYESANTPEQNVLIQEMLYGQEYGIDIINDLRGNYQTSIVKKKIAMRAGETDCAMTVQMKPLEKCGEKLSKNLRHIGNLDVDVISSQENKPYIIDMNARFGGGYPFSHCAGVDLPGAIIMWLEGKAVNKKMLTPQIGVKAYKDIGMISSTRVYNTLKSR